MGRRIPIIIENKFDWELNVLYYVTLAKRNVAKYSKGWRFKKLANKIKWDTTLYWKNGESIREELPRRCYYTRKNEQQLRSWMRSVINSKSAFHCRRVFISNWNWLIVLNRNNVDGKLNSVFIAGRISFPPCLHRNTIKTCWLVFRSRCFTETIYIYIYIYIYICVCVYISAFMELYITLNLFTPNLFVSMKQALYFT